MMDLTTPTTAEVAALVSTTCRSCHVVGGVAPFAFDTLGDLRRRSGVVEAVLTEGLMPPRLAHERDAISGCGRVKQNVNHCLVAQVASHKTKTS